MSTLGHGAGVADDANPLAAHWSRMNRPVPAGVCLSATQIPQPFHGLLVHNRDMTSTLEKFHEGSIHIRVLSQERHGDVYSREVVLERDRDARPLEFGVSRIFLDCLPPEVRKEILEARLPLGGILNSHGVPYRSRPSAFFAVEADKVIQSALGLDGPRRLYGRRNTLSRPDGAPFAEIIEILP